MINQMEAMRREIANVIMLITESNVNAPLSMLRAYHSHEVVLDS